MDSIYWALILSFIAGAMGYIIVRFWLIPIARYRQAKKALIASLKRCARKLAGDGVKDHKNLPGKKLLRELRQLNTRLIEVHELELPYWFRLLLMTRNESPSAASEAIERMENLSGATELRQCLDEAGRHLGTFF